MLGWEKAQLPVRHASKRGTVGLKVDSRIADIWKGIGNCAINLTDSEARGGEGRGERKKIEGECGL